ncbi:GGDEF domain-containing protein [Marinomonas sp.]
MLERLRSLLVPFVIFLASAYVCLQIRELTPLWSQLLAFSPIICALMGSFLAWHFNKGRALIAILLLLAPIVLSNLNQLAFLSGYWLASCVGFAMMTLLQERGFFNRFAINRLLLIGALMAWNYVLDQQWLGFGVLSNTRVYGDLSLSILLYWVTFSVSCLVIGLGWWRHGDMYRACSLISLLAMFVMAKAPVTPMQFTVLLSASLLVWVWFSLQESHRMAYVDDLTLLPGRRALNERLVSLPKNYALAMIDVDHFKKFNDTYGHDMGDKVLRQVAKKIKQAAKGRGYRFGGEEFTLVFTHKRLEDVKDILEGLREEIAEAEIYVVEPKTQQEIEVSVTVSIGLAIAEAGDKATQVLKRADEALYQSKKKGRNRISVGAVKS